MSEDIEKYTFIDKVKKHNSSLRITIPSRHNKYIKSGDIVLVTVKVINKVIIE
jgi:hypothetical protein